MEADPARAELGEAAHGVGRVERLPGRSAEGSRPGLPTVHNPKTKLCSGVGSRSDMATDGCSPPNLSSGSERMSRPAHPPAAPAASSPASTRSTQATKVLIVDVDSGAVVARGRAAHEVHGSGRRARERPGRLVVGARRGAAGDGLRRRGRRHRRRRPAARPGDPRRPRARRCAPPCSGTTRARRRTRERCATHRAPTGGPTATGGVPVASFTVSRWAWLRPHRACGRRAPRRASGCRTTSSPSASRRAAPTDRGDASGTGWWSTRAEDYLDEVLDLAVELDRALLPEVLGPVEAAGRGDTPRRAADARPAAGRPGRAGHRRQHGGRARRSGCGRASR